MATKMVKRDGDENAEPSAVGKEYAIGVVRGALAAIPYVGSLLNEIAFDARARVKQQRLEAFCAELGAEVGQLTDEKVDRAYLASDEFSDLFEEVANNVARERDDRKRAYFKNVLLQGIRGKRAPDFSSMFLSMLHEITVEELTVLKPFAEGVAWLREERRKAFQEREKGQVAGQLPVSDVRMEAIHYSNETILGFPSLAYREMIQSLIRKGLLFDASHGRWGAEAFTCVEGTDLGAALYHWISTS